MLPQQQALQPAPLVVTKKQEILNDLDRILTDFETRKKWGEIGISIRSGMVCVVAVTVTDRKNNAFEKGISHENRNFR